MGEPVKKKRPYDGTRRRAAAARTRAAVLRAAHELFTSRGYADTAVAEIAARAGVSVDTLYATVGRKPQLLLAVHDMELAGSDSPVAAADREYVRRMRAEPTAAGKIAIYAAALGEVLPRTVPLLVALRTAGASDPACREVWDAVRARRAGNMRLLAADLRSTGELREELDDDTVADLVWSMNDPEYFLLLATRGRTPAQYAALVRDVWTRTLLREPPRDASPAPGAPRTPRGS
ncbi:MAG: TetR/AcrR family transcriptional regulator [Pseudonocardia sp.]